MCGIAGVVNLRGGLDAPPRPLVERMVRAIVHRGPDEFGLYRDGRAALGHARLSIIDLATGQQPLSNEAGTLWVVFNGEIFNHVELREELEARGHRFRTRSDTEVIVHAWEEWGPAAPRRFNGQWAFALWDSAREELTLCRDRVGVRPLYVHEGGGRLRFASEVKALFQDPDVERAIDPSGLAEVFTFWGPVAPRTVFRGVRELPPGTLSVWRRDGAVTETRYWEPAFPAVEPREAREPYPYTLDEAAERLRDALQRATRLRLLRADVPVGAYVSGGIDSAVVAALARDAAPATFHTFSLRFEDAGFDETEHQRVMASFLGSTHHEVVAKRSDIARVFPDVIAHAERPLLRTGPAPLHLLSGLVRSEGLKVVLTGEGADEFLGGYDLFREAKVRRFWARDPRSTLRPRLFERLYPWLSRSPAMARGVALQFWARGLDAPDDPTFSHGPRWNTARALQRFFTPATRDAVSASDDAVASLVRRLPAEFSRWDPLARAQYLEITTLLSPYILSSQGDRVLMANSVEGRFPFLDADVMELANGLPASYKLRVLDEKHILKRMARGMIPASILERSKQPYRAPDAVCFVEEGAPAYVREALSRERVAGAGLFDPALVEGLYAKCARRARAPQDADAGLSNSDNMALVGVLSTQLLHERFVRARPEAPDASASPAFTTVIER